MGEVVRVLGAGREDGGVGTGGIGVGELMATVGGGRREKEGRKGTGVVRGEDAVYGRRW